jgi:hypothetical protein
MERKGKWGQSGVRAETHNFERRCAGPRRVTERVGAVTHRLLVRVVLVVVREQVDAEADAPGHGEEGDAPPLLHVSCAVGGGRGGRVRSVVGRAVYPSVWASVSVGQRNIDGASWGSRARRATATVSSNRPPRLPALRHPRRERRVEGRARSPRDRPRVTEPAREP